MSASESQERRQHPRFKLALPVEIRREGQPYGIKGETSDLSISGFYYPTMMQMPANTSIDITVWYGAEVLTCKGIVRTADPGVGNGIEFVNLDANARQSLSDFLNTFAAQEDLAE
ncbi:MAG TPA: PilZ domain-containing protein [Terriglobales bacterium]|nr:PilZ domain-containing protein [Terriglobales bacterium]